jgi:hypothetical protein
MSIVFRVKEDKWSIGCGSELVQETEFEGI